MEGWFICLQRPSRVLRRCIPLGPDPLVLTPFVCCHWCIARLLADLT